MTVLLSFNKVYSLKDPRNCIVGESSVGVIYIYRRSFLNCSKKTMFRNYSKQIYTKLFMMKKKKVLMLVHKILQSILASYRDD